MTRPDALMTRDEVAAVFGAALERKKRDRRNVYVSYSDAEELQARLDGRQLEKVGLYAPEFKDPISAAEWWDDLVIRHGSPLGGGSFPGSPVLVAVAAAARDGGADAARAALKGARQLEPQVQFSIYRNLVLWRKEDAAYRFGADLIVGQVLAEYERLRLPTEDPAAKTQGKRRRRAWDKLTESEATA
jgi:hypothetical protein